MVKLRVGVLMGGKSIEREVSFNSGRTICDHLDTMRYTITPLFQTVTNQLYILPWHFLHRGKINDFLARLPIEAAPVTWDDLKQYVDFIYIAMHGRYAEDGTLQGFLELLGIPYLGSKIFGSALSMDKVMQKKFLAMYGITTAKHVLVPRKYIADLSTYIGLIEQVMTDTVLSFPCIVKPTHEGSSFGVSIVYEAKQLVAALACAGFINEGHAQPVLIEEKIEGMEFACIIITDYSTGKPVALPPTEVVSDPHCGIFDYEQKYMPGRALEFTPARCSYAVQERIKQTCIATMQALNLSNLARIDGFVQPDGTVVIIDPNALSGMAPASFFFREAAHQNISHTQLINHLIETELQSYGMLAPLLAAQKKENIAMSTEKIRVGILMGGPSNEREISLESGRNVAYKLSPQKYQPVPLFVNDQMALFPLTQQLLVLNSTAQIAIALEQAKPVAWQDLASLVDFVFIGLHGGPGENGAVQGALEMLGISYNGSGVLTSSLCMDKFKTTQFLKTHGFDVPRNMLVSKIEWLTSADGVRMAIQDLGMPCIVKPHDDGCSVMVQKVADMDAFATAVETIFAHGKEYVLVEEFIRGMELTVGVVGNDEPRALPPSQAVSAAGILSIEEKFLPGAGENQTPAPLPKATLTLVQKTMEAVFKTIDAKGYVRIDCFYQDEQQSMTGKERVIILEVNTLPGLTPATCIFHQAAEVGIKPMDFIDLIITLGREEHAHTMSEVLQETPTASHHQ